MGKLNGEVTAFLDELNHPFRSEIEQLRRLIMSTTPGLTERIKWNGPNYSFGDEDRITMRIHPPSEQAQLIFHRGAIKQAQPKERLIQTSSSLLQWKENDRAIATFKDADHIKRNEAELAHIVKLWMEAAK